jgi:hypothetical protein
MIAIFVCLVIYIPRVQANGLESGNDLLKYCQATVNRLDGQQLTADAAHDSMLCIGYVEGRNRHTRSGSRNASRYQDI